MIDNLIKKAKEVIKKKQIKLIGESPSMGEQWQVKKRVVRLFKRPGRTLYTCTCENSTKFCNSPTICYHRLAVIIIKALQGGI